MIKIGTFKAKAHLAKIIRLVQDGEEVCLTHRHKEVAFIISADQYYKTKHGDIFKQWNELRKSNPIGSINDIIRMRNENRK